MNFDEQQEENVLILRACIRIWIARSKNDDEKKNITHLLVRTIEQIDFELRHWLLLANEKEIFVLKLVHMTPVRITNTPFFTLLSWYNFVLKLIFSFLLFFFSFFFLSSNGFNIQLAYDHDIAAL